MTKFEERLKRNHPVIYGTLELVSCMMMFITLFALTAIAGALQ